MTPGRVNVRRSMLLMLGALVAAPAAFAQRSSRPPKVGFITLASLSDLRVDAFRRGMQGLGYRDGETVVFEWRSADGNADRLPALAADLVRSQPAVIVAAQTQAISAMKQATSTIPIVFVGTPDPVSSGFVNSLAQPGGNLTGLSTSAADLGPKQIELLRFALPTCARVALLANPTNNASVVVRKTIATAALDMKLQLVSLDAQSLAEIEAALTEAKRSRVDAAIFAVDRFFIQVRAQIGEIALRLKPPTMFTQRDHVVAGGMMSYGPSVALQYERSARYVDRILRGARPAGIPVEQPTVYELVINLKTVKGLGITIPRPVLARADQLLD